MEGDPKAERRLLSNPHEAPFRDVRRVLESHGWREVRTRSSHRIFAKPGVSELLTIPVHRNRVKRAYIRIVVKTLGLKQDESNGETDSGE